ncbi:MAG: DUF99 family protein [Halodesulfurarchaeum sp.]|nr:DUF99 family protein [Halodesulfurarchaeum sp.]
MKDGVRALGVAESYQGAVSLLAGAVVTPNRVVDGFAFETCSVGGLDATAAIETLSASLEREDVQYLLVSGIAPAWFNVLDLEALHEATGLPVLSVSFEESPGLEEPIREAFSGVELERRLDRYEAQPDREPITVNGETRFVRSVGLSEPAERVVSAFTPVGGRPEPLRVARLAARGVEELVFERGVDTGAGGSNIDRTHRRDGES